MNNKISKWYYNDKEIDSIEEMKVHEPKVWGFVYLMSMKDIKTEELKYQYIGKKNIYSKRKRSFGKKEVASMKDKRGKKYEYVIKESDWKNYTSSNLFIKKNLGKFRIEREIILFGIDDSELTFKEAREIMCQGCLDDPMFLNFGVSIRRFSNKIIK